MGTLCIGSHQGEGRVGCGASACFRAGQMDFYLELSAKYGHPRLIRKAGLVQKKKPKKELSVVCSATVYRLGIFRVTEDTGRIHLQKIWRDLLWTLIHVTMKAGKSHSVPFASCRPIEFARVIQPDLEGWMQKMNLPAQQKRKTSPVLCFLFYLGSQRIRYSPTTLR